MNRDQFLAMRDRVLSTVSAEVMTEVMRRIQETDPHHVVELDGATRLHVLEVEADGWRMVHPTARCLLGDGGCAFQAAVEGLDVSGMPGRYAVVITDHETPLFGALPLSRNLIEEIPVVPETRPSQIQHAPANTVPVCGQPLPDGGTCGRVAGHMGKCG